MMAGIVAKTLHKPVHGIILTITNYSDARRFIFRQPAAACPKWPGVAAFRRRGTKFYQNLCFNFQAQKIVTYVPA